MAEPVASRGDAQLKTLMRLSFILDAAGEQVLGKGAPAMMYHAGRDTGRDRRLGTGIVGEDDIEEALVLILTEGEEVWRFERWQDPGGGRALDGERRPPDHMVAVQALPSDDACQKGRIETRRHFMPGHAWLCLRVHGGYPGPEGGH